jgi:GNAT superfamily N-acetyltransferase
MNTIELNPDDLAPGDQRSLAMDLSALRFHRIQSTADPLFRLAYDRLWREFGEKHEIETEDVLDRRFRSTDRGVRYEMIVATKLDQFAAVRDHTAIVSQYTPDSGAVVHLSHLLVDESMQRSGLAGWMRALPLQTARDALAAVGGSGPITLVGEMEPADAAHPDRMIRLKAYEKAGFLKIATPYLQPDFRPPADIDATGPQPLPMSLIVRRVGLEDERTMPQHDVRHLIASLYGMYARTFRVADMQACFDLLDALSGDETEVPLLPPTT